MRLTSVSHKLNIAFIIIDTISGFPIDCGDCVFFRTVDGEKKIMPLLKKDNGIYVLLGDDRTDFIFSFQVRGFEPVEEEIRYSEIDEKYPVRRIYLMPSDESPIRDSLYSIKGKIPGLTQVTGVDINNVSAHAVRYEPKTKTLLIFENATKLNVEGMPFGIMDVESGEFETFFVKMMPKNTSVILTAALNKAVNRNSPIGRVFYGNVDKEGNFQFKIKKDFVNPQEYILQFVINGECQYRKVDFHDRKEDEWELQL